MSKQITFKQRLFRHFCGIVAIFLLIVLIPIAVTALKTVEFTKETVNRPVEQVIANRDFNQRLSPSAFGNPSKSVSVSRSDRWNHGGLKGKLQVAWSISEEATAQAVKDDWKKLAEEIQQTIDKK